jgi:hypothetical protein
MSQCVLHGEHPAPGTSEQVDAVQADGLPDGAELVDEQLDRFEVGVGDRPQPIWS